MPTMIRTEQKYRDIAEKILQTDARMNEDKDKKNKKKKTKRKDGK